MISVSIVIPEDIIIAINEQIGRTPALMNRAYMRATSRLKSRMLEELRAQPGAPHYPLRWKSERQRRYVMALLRSENNIPYQRTGELSQGWQVNIDSADDGGSITVENDVPSARFVEGWDQQMMHSDTGWLFAPEVIDRYSEVFEETLIQTWFLICDPVGSVQGEL